MHKPIHSRNKTRLIRFIKRKLLKHIKPSRRQTFMRLAQRVMNNNDIESLNQMADIYPRLDVDASRASARITDIEQILDALSGDISYLDVGSGDGSIATSIATYLHLDKAHAHAIDIVDIPSSKALSTHVSDGKTLPFESNTFDFISAYMSMHHFQHLDAMLSEIRRVLKQDGVLLIREHDVSSTDTINHQYLYWIHVLYWVITEKHTADTYHKAAYKSQNEWRKKIEDDTGMQPVQYLLNHDSFMSYYETFK